MKTDKEVAGMFVRRDMLTEEQRNWVMARMLWEHLEALANVPQDREER